MTNKNVSVGIVGCGEIAAAHAAGYRKSGAGILALADSNQAAMEKMRATIPEAKPFVGYKELIDSGLVNAISICTPPSSHREIAVYALNRNIHVLCEKPLADTVEAGREIAAAAKGSGSQFMIAFRHRFLPAVQKIHDLLAQGKLGDLVFIHNIFSGPALFIKDKWFSKKAISGGGTLLDATSHSIDLFRYLAGEIVESHAVTHTHMEGIDVEDASVLIVKSANKALGSLTASWVAGDGSAILDVTGRNGRAIYDYSKSTELKVKEKGSDTFVTLPLELSFGFNEEIAHFLDSIRTGKSASPSIEDGLRVQQIVQDIYAGNKP